jgi:ABC-type arginine transport system permease subunit
MLCLIELVTASLINRFDTVQKGRQAVKESKLQFQFFRAAALVLFFFALLSHTPDVGGRCHRATTCFLLADG